MYSKILILRFPQSQVQEPITCNLVKNHDLTFNILHAKIFPRREGLMVLELAGQKKDFKAGVNYLKSVGVSVQNASQEVERDCASRQAPISPGVMKRTTTVPASK